MTNKINIPKGFTLIEVIIVISLFGMIAYLATSFLWTSLSSTGKSEIIKEIRQNGDYALSAMESLVLSSRTATCSATPDNRIYLHDNNGFSTQLYCNEGFKISSISAEQIDLTASNVVINDCNFTCTQNPGLPVTVHFEFSVSKSDASLRGNTQSIQEYKLDVVAPRVN